MTRTIRQKSASRPPSYKETSETTDIPLGAYKTIGKDDTELSVVIPSPTPTIVTTMTPNAVPTINASTNTRATRQTQAQQQQEAAPPAHKCCTCANRLLSMVAFLLVIGLVCFSFWVSLPRRSCHGYHSHDSNERLTNETSMSMTGYPTATMTGNTTLFTESSLSQVMEITSTARPITATDMTFWRRNEVSWTTFATITWEAIIAGRPGV